MEPNAQVTFCNISFYLISPYFSGGHSTRPKLGQECNVPNFCTLFYRQQAQKYEPISIRDITRWVVRNKLDTFGFSQLMLHVWLYNKETIGRNIIQVWVWPQDNRAASLSKCHWHRGKLAWFAKGFVGLWGDFVCMLCPLEITGISDAYVLSLRYTLECCPSRSTRSFLLKDVNGFALCSVESYAAR